jgi:hypothetical protein
MTKGIAAGRKLSLPGLTRQSILLLKTAFED